jgi:hypothetical protein
MAAAVVENGVDCSSIEAIAFRRLKSLSIPEVPSVVLGSD